MSISLHTERGVSFQVYLSSHDFAYTHHLQKTGIAAPFEEEAVLAEFVLQKQILTFYCLFVQ